MKVDKYEFPDDLYYSKDHMYAKTEEGIVVVGLTDYGQGIAGAIEYVDLPEVGEEISQNEVLTTIETGKWVGPLRAPVSGEIVEVNEELEDSPELVNQDPYGKGWIVKIKPSNLQEDLDKLMKAGKELETFIKEEIEKKKEE